MLDFQHVDHAIAQLVEEAEQLDHLLPQKEVSGVEFRSGTVFAGELDLADDARSRVEDGLAILDSERLDATEVDELHQFDQPLTGWRNIVFLWRRVHASHKRNACANSENTPFL